MDEKYVLREPVGDIREINFPLQKLKGGDIVAAQSEFETLTGSITTSMLELNKGFHAYIISKVAQIPYETVLELSIKDFSYLTMRVQNFLLPSVPAPTA
ncbi:MAG: phage tail assembly protein [Synergistaceae bacterium]|jgi:hypothetical protein|nr:phage tail assembly protein [Synergistaceae bacterium]